MPQYPGQNRSTVRQDRMDQPETPSQAEGERDPKDQEKRSPRPPKPSQAEGERDTQN